jgi:N,N'-diacetyllegionaminate synthase
MTGEIRIGEHTIRNGGPVFVVAEAGVNHDGELGVALELVDAAARAGADAVKFQTFDPAELVTADSTLASYQRRGETSASGQFEMLSRLRFGAAEHEALVRRCHERGVMFLSTPFDAGSAALLDSLDVAAFKVGSGELTNLPFLDELTSYGRPILLSTGMGTLAEVAAAVAAIDDRVPLALLHCTSSYPAPDGDANLRAIDTMHDRFGLAVGYSDHAEGLELSLAAVARDACIIERHLTLDRARPGPDHAMSLEPSELTELVGRIRALETWLGDGVKQPQASEIELRVVARRSVVAARALRAGEALDARALAVKRPGDGLAPSMVGSLIGRRLRHAVPADRQLSLEDLEPQ